MLLNDLSILGLACRARKISTGDKAIESIQKKRAQLALLASDASENTKKRISDKCRYYQIELIEVDSMERLSSAIGKELCAYMTVDDIGFAKSIKSRIGR